jgi:hypothetical protein
MPRDEGCRRLVRFAVLCVLRGANLCVVCIWRLCVCSSLFWFGFRGYAAGGMGIFRHFGKRHSVLLLPPLPDPHTHLANPPRLNYPHDGDYSFCRNVRRSYCSTWHIPETRPDALVTSYIVNKTKLGELCGMPRRSNGIITRYRSIQICHCTQSVTGDSSVLSLQRFSSTGPTYRAYRRNYIKFSILLTFRGPCIVIYSYNESQRDTLFLIFIW